MKWHAKKLVQVDIGLLHDLKVAKFVATEPLTPDDWEILVGAHFWVSTSVL